MALIKNPTPAFESADDVVVVDEAVMTEDAGSSAPAAVAAKPSAAAPVKPTEKPVEVAATKAVAVAVAGALTAPKVGVKYSAAMQHLQYAFSMEDVRSIGLAAPRVTVDTGGFSKDGKDLGKELTIQLLSYNPRWLVSAGIQGDEGKELVRYSYDGITVDGESQTLKAYLDELKADGYAKAAIKEYFDVWGIVVGGPEEAADILGETVVVQLSPQSAGQFKWFTVNQGVKIARGLAQETDTLKLKVERTKMGSDTFGRVAFSAA